MAIDHDYDLKVTAHGRWTHVHADCDGRDVSHLGYAPHQLQLGREASVRMAGIGGVGTDREHRRRGLARKVLERALTEMTKDGYNAVGLYTSRAIVAHRLYRRFGFIDLASRSSYVKVLDPATLAKKMLTELVSHSEGMRSRLLTISLCIGSAKPIAFRIQGNDASSLPRVPRAVDLTLELSEKALVILGHQATLDYACDAKLVRWTGDPSVYAMVARAIESCREPIHEE